MWRWFLEGFVFKFFLLYCLESVLRGILFVWFLCFVCVVGFSFSFSFGFSLSFSGFEGEDLRLEFEFWRLFF